MLRYRGYDEIMVMPERVRQAARFVAHPSSWDRE